MGRPLLFVGSLGLDSAESAFRALATTVGPRTSFYPDGEPGERRRWIIWQERVIAGHSDFERVAAADGGASPIPTFARQLKGSADPAKVGFGSLGYADEAEASYEVFVRLRDDGVIPEVVRMQVSLPTPLAFLTTFVALDDAAKVASAYEQAMAREVADLCRRIPNRDLAIQWDVAHEMIAQAGAWEIYYEPTIENHVNRLAKLCALVPSDVALGVHLCYGDPGHKHVVEPTDTEACVSVSNGLLGAVGRTIDWVHFPVPRDRTDAGYYEPLAALTVPHGTMIFAGLIHFTDGVEGARQRIAQVERHLTTFGLATECGFGRRDPSTIAPLLEMHAAIADLD